MKCSARCVYLDFSSDEWNATDYRWLIFVERRNEYVRCSIYCVQLEFCFVWRETWLSLFFSFFFWWEKRLKLIRCSTVCLDYALYFICELKGMLTVDFFVEKIANDGFLILCFFFRPICIKIETNHQEPLFCPSTLTNLLDFHLVTLNCNNLFRPWQNWHIFSNNSITLNWFRSFSG